MTILVDDMSYKESLLTEIGLITSYLDDLLNLSAGSYPNWDDFARATTVRNWRLGKVEIDAIVGNRSGFETADQVSKRLQILSTRGG